MGSKFGDKLKKFSGSALFRGVVGSLPFGIGSLASNVLAETDKSKQGTISTEELTPQLIKLGFYIVLVLMALRGWISFEDVEQAKEVITP